MGRSVVSRFTGEGVSSSRLHVTLSDIKQARSFIAPYVQKTMIDFSSSVSQIAGVKVFLKFENLQQTGSFKIRGAAHKLLSLTAPEKKHGVIAASAGNHAQGVACMAKQLGIPATIVMPKTSPLIKITSTKRFGPKVILEGTNYDECYAFARDLQQKEGLKFVHPYEDEKVIAGQGTVGLEVVEDLTDLDAIVVPVGGGGLISGIATAVKALSPSTKVFGVQAQGAGSMARSFQNKKLDLETPFSSTIADGIAVKKPSLAMYESFIAPLCDDVVTVTESEIAHAIVFAMERAKTVLEGAGSVGLAAVLCGRIPVGSMKKIVVVLSGGNIDFNILSRVINRGLQSFGRLCRIMVACSDVPGSLSRLTSLVAEKGANILEINHSRLSQSLDLKETFIEFMLETNGFDQIEEIKAGFRQLGGRVLEYQPEF